ncbi:MAG: glycosyl hydrolase 53 family protein [Lachnospiraceae bacterium]|nr:glycosyl hydrolase 53 family protein [Lachnospiraceae bacterium]
MKRKKVKWGICLLAAMIAGANIPTTQLSAAESNTTALAAEATSAAKNAVDTEAYLFVHFTGNEKGANDEQLYFSVSEDGSHWIDLNNNEPVITSTVGDKGVRDPFILRSAEGDKFYILATDLSIYNRTSIYGSNGNAWTSCLTPGQGSTGMVIWESADLVHWEKERLVDVAGSIPGAGNLWAPEAFYDEKTGEYIVYWATWSEESNAVGDGQNIYYAKTKDFYTFTEPVLWIDTESAILDTTMIQVDDMYYRASAADGQIRLDKSEDTFGEWETVSTLQGIFGNNKYSGNYLEGPELFTYCKKDWLTNADGESVPTYGLMADQFKEKKGYLPFRSTDLSDTTTASWSVAADVDFGALQKRHGSILTITAEEYDRIRTAYDETYEGGDMSVTAPIDVKKVKGLSEDFIHGIDVSTYMSQIQSGVKYYDENGVEKNMFEIFSNAGVNYVRLRVWNCPFRVDGNGDYLYVDGKGTEYTADKVTTTKDENGFNVYTLKSDGTTVYREGYGAGNCDIETAAAIGKIATEYGMKVLVDFHYSDFWADPSKYRVPKAWEGMSLDEKADELYTYTKDCIEKMQAAGVDVGMVQIGNEINGGMAGEKNMSNICTLLKAGSQAVREVNEDILIAVHYANPEKGQHDDRAKDLYNAGVDYDVFASSYYPFWHGTLENLTSVLKDIAETYDKKVMVTEVSYCHTFEDGDGHVNVVREGAAYQEYNYPISVEGQATAVRDVIEAVAAVGEMGLGTFYWEPAWIPVENYADASDKEAVLASNSDKWQKYGSGWASIYSGDGGDDYDPGVTADPTTHGSEWDNQALFDFNGKALPSMNVYKWVYTGAKKNLITVSKTYQEIFPDADNSAASNKELLKDGTFEDSVTNNGWNFVNSGVWYGAGTYHEPEEVDGKNAPSAANGGIYQKVYLEAGQTYQIQMDLYMTGSPANSGIGIYAAKGDNAQYTGDFKYGYLNLSSVGELESAIDFTKFNEWQTMKGSYTPDTSGYYFISVWGGDSGNKTYLSNVSCTEEGRYDYTTTEFKISDGSGVTFTSGEYSKAYKWSELLGEAYDKDAYVTFVITGIASTNAVEVSLLAREEENNSKPDDENNTENNTENTSKPVSYTVTFMDGVIVLGTQTVTEGGNAQAPKVQGKSGYTFEGWSTSFDKVTTNLTVNAKWKKVAKPAKVKKVKAKNSAKKTLKVTFQKVKDVDGYEIRYALKSNMKKAKKVTSLSTSKKIKKLKKGKTYYVQVRAYRVDSTGKKIYSKAYSSKVKVKIKK